LLVVCPTWVGDVVMATPTLRALRELFPEAYIAALGREVARPLLEGCPWVDRVMVIRRGEKGRQPRQRDSFIGVSRRLAALKFDTAVLLANSFRTALLTRLAGIDRRIGYDRDARGFLLTEHLLPRKQKGRFVPVPTRDYYLGLARYLGAANPDPAMQLFTTPADDNRAADMLRAAGYHPDTGRPLVLLNPGANYGEAKLYLPERFAAVADRCAAQFDAAIAVTGSPNEKVIIDQVIAAARTPMIDLVSAGIDLATLKSVVRRSDLMITNDTGPRHIAAAFGTPVVTIFGPTDPAWTEIDFAEERQVRVEVYCGPCQKKRCPLTGTADELICMKRIDAPMVFDAAAELLSARLARRANAAGSSRVAPAAPTTALSNDAGTGP